MVDIPQISADKLSADQLANLIKEKKSFIVKDVHNIGYSVNLIESAIEGLGLSCRVYTEYRSTSLVAELLIPGVGWAAALGMAAHNLATFNPDYEIGKNKIGGTLTVKYKK